MPLHQSFRQTRERQKIRPGRRSFLRLAAGAGAAAWVGRWARAADPAGEPLPAFPEKSDFVLQTDRPPNLEMPLKYLAEDFTPNEVFYSRWHLAILPTQLDVAAFRLEVGGHVQSPLRFSLDELRKNFEPVSVVAVNQCSGNSRSFFEPRMPGVQWGNGAIGNARWTGVRLKDVLARAGVKARAVDVSFNGLDGPVLPAAAGFAGTPDFEKSLPFDRANDGQVMIAYEMNGRPLPMLNGFPLRLIVPGWYATYWVKALNQITVHDKPFDGFWMAKAYRVPNTPNFQEDPKNLAKETIPISRMTTRSLFARPLAGESVPSGKPFEIQGLALDGGSGIRKVEVSLNAGQSWTDAKLDPEIGTFSWRRWRHTWQPAAGKHQLRVKATNNAGETQTDAQWNRSGYARNVIESIEVAVS